MTASARKRISTVQVQKKRPDARFADHIGITCGGSNTKIHAIVDEPGNLLYVHNGGRISDITVVSDLLEHMMCLVSSSWQTKHMEWQTFG